MSPWIPVVVSVAALVVGLALQGLGYAYFLGRMKEGHDSTSRLVESLIRRMEKNDESALSRAEEKGDLNARLEHVEGNTAGIADLRMSLVKLNAQFEAHSGDARRNAELIRTDMSALQRQIQALMTGKGGAVIRIDSPHGSREDG